MSDYQPSPPPDGPGLSPDELAERELIDIMTSSPEHHTEPADDNEVDELDLDGTLADTPTSSTRTLASLRCDLEAGKRKAAQLRLHPYQRVNVEEFIKGSSNFQQMMLFVQLCAVENQISAFRASAPPFVSPPALIENIKSFVIGVLLSSKLSAYKKGSVPVELVMKILTSTPRSYVPENLASDSFIQKVVKSDIQEELTQTRARLKKAIRDSLAADPKEAESIFDLASNIIANSKSSVTVPLCGRIALLRKIYVESPDFSYWDKVDKRLLLIRTTAAGDPKKIAKMFEHILQIDRNKYGNNTDYTLSDAMDDTFQHSVDSVIDASS